MTIFNPDPKLQAEQMINAFVWDENLIEYTDDMSGTIERRNLYRQEAIPLVLIAAKMCFWVANSYCPMITEPPNATMKDITYWRSVIEELKKL